LDGANPFGDTLFTPCNWTIVDGLKRSQQEAGETRARIALAWACGRSGITSTLMGVSRAEQVRNNGAALTSSFPQSSVMLSIS
jgi:aryl-alcohol dehydrogenase-like predicted oxidoreductase